MIASVSIIVIEYMELAIGLTVLKSSSDTTPSNAILTKMAKQLTHRYPHMSNRPSDMMDMSTPKKGNR